MYPVVRAPPGRVDTKEDMSAETVTSFEEVAAAPEVEEVGLFVPDATVGVEDAVGVWPA